MRCNNKQWKLCKAQTLVFGLAQAELLPHSTLSCAPPHSTPLHSTPLHSTPLHSTPLHSTHHPLMINSPPAQFSAPLITLPNTTHPLPHPLPHPSTGRPITHPLPRPLPYPPPHPLLCPACSPPPEPSGARGVGCTSAGSGQRCPSRGEAGAG